MKSQVVGISLRRGVTGKVKGIGERISRIINGVKDGID